MKILLQEALQKMVQRIFTSIMLLCSLTVSAQKVGVGTTTPVAKLDIHGPFANPLLPGLSSNGILRIAVNQYEALDIGKMGGPSYAAWIQSGFNNNTADALSLQPLGGSTGIGTATPVASAVLDVTSTTQGFLPPRMTFAQRNAIPSPAAGLIIYCTDCEAIQFFNGAIWKNLNGEPAVNFIYPHIRYCEDDWMTKNLNVDKYRNGDPIPKVTNPATWATLTTGAYCYYNNDSTTYAAIYGKIYNWYAVVDPRGLAPEGWRIPSNAEFIELGNCLGGASIAGGKMKEPGTSHWLAPNTGATNSSGFTALPGGTRYALDGHFFGFGEYGGYWTSTEVSPPFVQAYANYYNTPFLHGMGFDKSGGLSVRCIRDH